MMLQYTMEQIKVHFVSSGVNALENKIVFCCNLNHLVCPCTHILLKLKSFKCENCSNAMSKLAATAMTTMA